MPSTAALIASSYAFWLAARASSRAFFAAFSAATESDFALFSAARAAFSAATASSYFFCSAATKATRPFWRVSLSSLYALSAAAFLSLMLFRSSACSALSLTTYSRSRVSITSFIPGVKTPSAVISNCWKRGSFTSLKSWVSTIMVSFAKETMGAKADIAFFHWFTMKSLLGSAHFSLNSISRTAASGSASISSSRRACISSMRPRKALL